jgi:hypothetical protein
MHWFTCFHTLFHETHKTQTHTHTIQSKFLSAWSTRPRVNSIYTAGYSLDAPASGISNLKVCEASSRSGKATGWELVGGAGLAGNFNTGADSRIGGPRKFQYSTVALTRTSAFSLLDFYEHGTSTASTKSADPAANNSHALLDGWLHAVATKVNSPLTPGEYVHPDMAVYRYAPTGRATTSSAEVATRYADSPAFSSGEPVWPPAYHSLLSNLSSIPCGLTVRDTSGGKV